MLTAKDIITLCSDDGTYKIKKIKLETHTLIPLLKAALKMAEALEGIGGKDGDTTQKGFEMQVDKKQALEGLEDWNLLNTRPSQDKMI